MSFLKRFADAEAISNANGSGGFLDRYKDAEQNYTTKDGRWEILDGDTVKDVKTGESFRLGGINAAETPKEFKGEGGQFGGIAAKNKLLEIANTRGLNIERSGETGKYGREIVRYLDNEGRDIAGEMIRHGDGFRAFDESGRYTDEQYMANLEAQDPIPEFQQKANEQYLASNPGAPSYYSRSGTFARSMDRGTDQTQAMLYGAANAVGELFEFDAMAEWGLEGVERNLKEAAYNPAEIASYEDIESLSDAWTYVVEAIGEQAPQLGVDLGVGLATGGMSAAGSVAARAGAAKMLQRKIGAERFGKLLKNKYYKQKVAAKYAGIEQKGFKYGVLGGMQAQMTGEAQLEFMEQGIDAPGSAIAVGAVNSLIEFKALSKLIEPILKKAKRTGTDPVTLRNALGSAFKQAGVGVPVEGLTEMAQTFTTKLAAQAHGGDSAFSDEAYREYINAGLKGSIVGGALSGGASLGSSAVDAMGAEYVKKLEETDQEISDVIEDTLESEGGLPDDESVTQEQGETETGAVDTEQTTGSVQSEVTPKPGDKAFNPEPETNLDAQQERVTQPEFADRVMFISRRQRTWAKRLDEHRKAGLPFVSEKDAVILFADEQAKKEYQQIAKDEGSTKARQMVKGFTQDINTVRPDTAQVVQRHDAEGRLIEEEAVDPENVERAIQNQGERAEEGDTPRVVSSVQAMEERQQQAEADGYSPPESGEGVFGSRTANSYEPQAGSMSIPQQDSVDYSGQLQQPQQVTEQQAPSKTERGAATAKAIRENPPPARPEFAEQDFNSLEAPTPDELPSDLIYAPNGKPWPYRSAAEAHNKEGKFDVVELTPNAYALKERPANEQTGQEEDSDDASATGVVQNGEPSEGVGGTGTDATGRVSGAGLAEVGETGGEIQKPRGLRGENLLRQRIRNAGVEIPDIKKAQLATLKSLAGQDSSVGADAKLLLERAEKYVDYFGLELLEATRLAAAESIVIRQEDEAYLADITQGMPDNVILDTTGSNDLGDNLDDYNDNSAEFSDNLRIQETEEQENEDSPEKVAQFLTDRNVPPSAFEEMQQRYLEWGEAKFPTYDFYLIDKPDSKTGEAVSTYTKTVTQKNGKKVKKTYEKPYRTIKGEPKTFATAKEALEYAKELGLRRKGNLFHPKKVGDVYTLEKLRRPSHELADTDNIDAYFEEYVAKARKQARAANGASQNIRKIEFRRVADWVTGLPMNENVMLHAPTITEMGRKIAPFMERDGYGKETRTMDEKHSLWFNFGLSVLLDRGYMPRNMEIDTGRTDKNGNPILKPRNIAFTPELIPQTTDQYFGKRRELGRMLDRVTALEKEEVEVAGQVATATKELKRVASGMTPSEAKRFESLDKKIKRGLALIEQLMAFQKQLLSMESAEGTDIEQDLWQNAASLMEARDHLAEAVKRRKALQGSDHGVDLSPVMNKLNTYIRKLNNKLNDGRGEQRSLKKKIGEHTNRKLEDYDRDEFGDKPAGDTDDFNFSQKNTKEGVVTLTGKAEGNEDVRSVASPDDSVAEVSNLTLEERDGYTPENPRTFDPLNDAHLAKVTKRKKEHKVSTNGSSITKDEQSFVENVLRKLGAKMNVHIVDRHWYDVNKHELPKHRHVLPKESMKGFYLDLDGEHLIVLNGFKQGVMPKGKTKKGDADKKRELRGQRMYILAHELAHALEQRFFDNLTDNQKGILTEAYKQYREKGGGLNKREWLADKVGAHLYDKASKRGSYKKEDTVARNIAARLRTFYRAAAGFIKQRFGLNKSVSQVMDELIESGAFRGLIENRGKADPVAFELDADGREVLGPVLGKMKGLALAIKKQASKTGVAWKVATFLRTSDSQLRDLDEEYADAWHMTPGSKKTLQNWLTGKVLNGGFHFRVLSARGRLWSEFMDTKHGSKSLKDYYHKPKGIFSIHEQVKEDKQQEVMKAIKELNDGGPYTTDFAKMVRKALDTLHAGYLKHALPTMGYLENYFPVMMNTVALTGNRKVAKEIMAKHKADEWTRQQVKRLEDQGHEVGIDQHYYIESRMIEKADGIADEVIDNILNGGGSYELAVLMDQSVLGPGFVHNRARDWFNSPKMVEELNKHGLMETDFAKMMFNYVASSVKRAEFERGFGGYQRIEGAREPTSLRQVNRQIMGDTKRELKPEDINEIEERKRRADKGESSIMKAYGWNIMGIDPFELGNQAKRYLNFRGMEKGSSGYEATEKLIHQFEDSLTGPQYGHWSEVKELIEGYGGNYHKPLLEKLESYGYMKETRDGSLEFYTPAAGIKAFLQKIHANHPKAGRKRAETLTRANLGQLGSEIDPDVQAAMSTIMAYESVLVLAFSTMSSFPDIVGGVLRNRDISGMFDAMKELGALWKKQAFSRDEYNLLKDEVREVGLIGQRISQAVLQEMFGSAYSSEKSQQVLDTLFHYNGQEAWTNYTRVVNYQLAKSSIKRWVDLAKKDDPKAKEYLKEFGITAEEYGKWDGKVFKAGNVAALDNLTGDARKAMKAKLALRAKVQAAHIRFVEESIVRPDPSQRPAWASDPRFMLVWHLKSFFYSYGKIIVLPFLAHMQSQIAEAGNGKQGAEKIMLYGKETAVQALPLITASVLLFGLAAFGWEARELIQYNAFGKEGRTDKMAWDDYLFELSSRAGVYGPAELAMNLGTGYGDSDRRAAALLGPSFDHLITLLKSDWDQKLYRSTPGLNQLPGLKQSLSE